MNKDTSTLSAPRDMPARVDVVVIGAGFAGLYAHHRLRTLGLTAFGFEAASGVGGTWYWNRYPGARCDVESLDYTYSFSEELLQNWRWSERFATQPEILRYIDHVADRFDLRRDIAFNTRVTAASRDDKANEWVVATDRGDTVRCQFLLTCVGCLSLPKPPEFPGLEAFEGRWLQTGAWPHEPVEFADKRVAVIGTGSSGIQSIPLIAQQAKHLVVFQRTANYSVPAHNGPIDPAYEAQVRADYAGHCQRNLQTKGGVPDRINSGLSAMEVSEEFRLAKYEQAWQFGTFSLQSVFKDTSVNPDSNAAAAAFVHNKIREIVKDPATAAKLTPRGYPFGTKRLCLDTDYYATFNRDNVTLVDLHETPIEHLTPRGIKTSDREYPFDLIVFATGFDAITGPLLALNLCGSTGQTLKDVWAEGPTSYLGLMIAGFPNLFTVNGPLSPSVLVNMLPAIEHHIDWIADCITHLRRQGFDRVEPSHEAQSQWVEEVGGIAAMTLYPQANSWYMGANVPGKPRVFMAYVGGFDRYIERCRKVVDDGYTGLRFSTSTHAADDREALRTGPLFVGDLPQ